MDQHPAAAVDFDAGGLKANRQTQQSSLEEQTQHHHNDRSEVNTERRIAPYFPTAAQTTLPTQNDTQARSADNWEAPQRG